MEKGSSYANDAGSTTRPQVTGVTPALPGQGADKLDDGREYLPTLEGTLETRREGHGQPSWDTDGAPARTLHRVARGRLSLSSAPWKRESQPWGAGAAPVGMTEITSPGDTQRARGRGRGWPCTWGAQGDG